MEREVRAELRNKIWSIEAEWRDGNGINNVIIGGGICISSEGLILTVAQVVPANVKEIRARTLNDYGFRTPENHGFRFKCKLLRSDSHFDLALFWAAKGDGEEFPFFDLSMPQVSMGDEVFAFLHRERIPYSFYRGTVAYRYVALEKFDLKVQTPRGRGL